MMQSGFAGSVNSSVNDSINGSSLTSPFVMVVEDDPVLRGLLSKALQRRGHRVREVENGLAAKSVFDLCHERIELVISDVRMPILGGVDLLKHIRTRSQVPFIVMTGFSEILEAEQAFELGANDFITKPFKSRDLISAIDRCFATAAESQPSQTKPLNPVYCAVHISEILGSSIAIADAYAQLAEDKFLRVVQSGEAVPVDRLKIYHERGVDFLYVTAADFPKFVEFKPRTETDANVLDTNAEEKIAFLRQNSEILAKRCFLNQVDPVMSRPAVKMVEDILALMVADAKLFDILANFRAHSESMYAQGLGVAVYACMAARRNGWTSTNTQFKIVASSLLRDVGCQENDSNWLMHPDRSREIVNRIEGLHEDIGTIVFQHHEESEGTGFPLAVCEESIHPIAGLIGLVDKFASHIIPLDPSVSPIDPLLSLARISVAKADEPGQKHFEYLLRLFNVRTEEIRVVA